MADPTKPDSGFASALVALLQHLGTTLAPKPLVAPQHVLDAQEAAAMGGQQPAVAPPQAAAPVPQGPVPRVPLGNQSPGLGNSW